MNYVGWHGQTLAQHNNNTSQYLDEGYGFVTLSVYGSPSSPYYAAVMIQPAPAPQHHYPSVPDNQWQQLFDSEAAQGYGPAIVCATGPAATPLYAAVFEPQNPIALTRNGLPSGPDPWNVQQINNSGVTNGPGAAGDLFVSVYNDQLHFSYRDGQGHIQDAWYGTDGWHLQQLTQAPASVGTEYIVPTPGPQAAGDLFVSVYNNQQHFAYRDVKNNIQDVWYGADGWHLQQLTRGPASVANEYIVSTPGPQAAGDLSVSVYNNQQHFAYRDVRNNIQDVWYGADGWNLQQLTQGPASVGNEYIVPTPGPQATGDLFVSVYNNQQHFAYRDVKNNIQDVWYGTDGWHLQQLTQGPAGVANEYIVPTPGPHAAGDLSVSVYNDQQHFAYRDRKNNIQDVWYGTDGWHLQQLTQAPASVANEYIVPTPGPQAAGDLFVSVYNNQQHFTYRDAIGNIQDVWYGGSNWNFQTINNTGVTGGPAAAGGLFVCVYKNEDHFSYLDQGGNIQDAWYNGGPSTIQAVDAQAKRQGLILRWAGSYGDSENPTFIAVWAPNSGQTLWSNDGILDSASTYQGRFNAEYSGWCRPAFVTLNASGQYLSVFVDNQVGHWQANHVLTPAQYQSAFDTWKQQGYFPVCVQAAGADANSATFSAIAVQSQSIVAKSFSANGPVANAQIDAVIQPLMAAYGVRHAALAIVHNTTLVYARGYTLAEPGWPIAQPTTCFRLASVSKSVTALAIYQLIEEGKLQLKDTLQSILGLQTPSGGAPSDKRFSQITIQQLLEHTSGLPDGSQDAAVAIRDAFIAAGKPATLPVSAAMTDSYVAGQQLLSNPGSTQVYNNCGYYMLARVVGKLRNASRPIDAYQQYLLNPLSITRIRLGVSLVADQPADEARYQNYNLPVYPSVMSDAQPLVPDVYGNVQLEIHEGDGGLSAAATDLARLIAILISQKDNPALKRATLVSMLSAGAKLTAAGDSRAGYGFDSVTSLKNGQFYAQKGGLLGSSSSVLQFNGQWGFTMLWGSGQPGSLPGQAWYPNFPAVMNIATSAQWGSGDLFPQFGMPSLG